MNWLVIYTDEANDDVKRLSGNQIKIVLKSINRVAINPISRYQGGYGHPLGRRGNIDLTGCFKIKLKKLGLRVIYRLEQKDNTMVIIVIGARNDNEAYIEAAKRIQKE